MAALAEEFECGAYYVAARDEIDTHNELVREAVANKENISRETWRKLIRDPSYSIAKTAILNPKFAEELSVSDFFAAYAQHKDLAGVLINERFDQIICHHTNTRKDLEEFHNFVLNNKEDYIPKEENYKRVALRVDNKVVVLFAKDAAELVRSKEDIPLNKELFEEFAGSQSYLVREAVASKQNISEKTLRGLVFDSSYSVARSAVLNPAFADKISVNVFFEIYDRHKGLAGVLKKERLYKIVTSKENTEEELKKFYTLFYDRV